MNYSEFIKICKKAVVEHYNEIEKNEIKISIDDIFEVWFNQNLLSIRTMMATSVSGDGMYYDIQNEYKNNSLYVRVFKQIFKKTVSAEESIDTEGFINICKSLILEFNPNIKDIEISWHVKSLNTHKAILDVFPNNNHLLIEMTYDRIKKVIYFDAYNMIDFNINDISVYTDK